MRFHGCTVIDLHEQIGNKKGEMSDNDLKLLATVIADLYHEKGYSEARVKKMALAKDGGLDVYIDEGVIAGVRVSGVNENQAKEIAAVIVPAEGEAYNEFIIAGRSDDAMHRFRARAVTVVPERDESGALILFIKVEKKEKGKIYAEVTTSMAYGITPAIGYYHVFDSAAADSKIFAGFTFYELRKAGAAFDFYSTWNKSLIWYAGVRGEHIVDIWQSKNIEFTTNAVQPRAGIRYRLSAAAVLDWYISERIMGMDRYGDYDGNAYDTRAALELTVNDRELRLNPREGKRLHCLISGGYVDLDPHPYARATFTAEAPVFPFSSAVFRIVPSLQVVYTTSRERYLWEYVYDYDFFIRNADYTSSRWKNTAGLWCEFEIQKNFFYAGPFANAGYFIDEQGEWRLESGAGIRAGLELGSVTVAGIYVRDVRSFSSGGSFLILIYGTF